MGQFNEKVRDLLRVVNTAPRLDDSAKRRMRTLTLEMQKDYEAMISRLNQQIIEFKQTMNQFQDDVQARSQRWRLDFEDQQRVLLHMQGINEQLKAETVALRKEHEEQLQAVREEYREKADKREVMERMKSGSNRTEMAQRIKQRLDYVAQFGTYLHSELQKAYRAQPDGQRQGQGQVQAQLQHLAQHMQTFAANMDEATRLAMEAASSSSSTADAQREDRELMVQQYETKLKRQSEQIRKLKQQKKEMVTLVNDKMMDLKFIHQQELQKERHIANVLASNHAKQVESLKERLRENGDRANYRHTHEDEEKAEMRREMEQLKKMLSQSMMENRALKQSKKSLENMVVKLSSDIVQTTGKRF